MLKGFICLLLFQLLGEAAVELTRSPVPGPVAGMLLLLVWLLISGGPSDDLGNTSHSLVQYLSLFFLPAGVGLFFLPEHISAQWPAIGAAMVAGTLLSMLFTGWLVKRLSGKRAASGEG
jgi:holin-like protein